MQRPITCHLIDQEVRRLPGSDALVRETGIGPRSRGRSKNPMPATSRRSFFPVPDVVKQTKSESGVKLGLHFRVSYRGWSSTIATCNPVTYLLDSLRAPIADGWQVRVLTKGLPSLAGIGAVSMTLAFFALQRRPNRGRETTMKTGSGGDWNLRPRSSEGHVELPSSELAHDLLEPRSV